MDFEKLETMLTELTGEQIAEVIENYAERRVNEMDTKSLIQFAYYAVIENLTHQEPKDILEQIFTIYDEETIKEIIGSVVNN